MILCNRIQNLGAQCDVVVHEEKERDVARVDAVYIRFNQLPPSNT